MSIILTWRFISFFVRFDSVPSCTELRDMGDFLRVAATRGVSNEITDEAEHNDGDHRARSRRNHNLFFKIT